MKRLSAQLVAILCLVGLSAPAGARRVKPLADVVTKSGSVTINWSRGVLTATAGASADLRAPTAKIARVKAERSARELATKTLVTAAGTLPHGNGTVKDALAKDETLRAKLATEVVSMGAQYGSDGSMVVTMALPIESIRRTLRGASEPPKESPGGALVIDARSTKLAPRLGLTLSAGGERYEGPVLYRRGRRAKLTATAVKSGVLELPESASSAVAKARDAGFVIIVLVN